MTRPSAPCRMADPALPGEGSQVTPGRVAELPARQCTRCGGVGTHYLTCPSLRLPPGYRLRDAAGLDGRDEAGHRTNDYFVSLYDYIMCCTRRAGVLGEQPDRERNAMRDTWT